VKPRRTSRSISLFIANHLLHCQKVLLLQQHRKRLVVIPNHQSLIQLRTLRDVQLREYGHANQPHLVRDIQQKKKILDVLESATRGLRRMEAVLDRVPEQQVNALLAKLQAPPLSEIADMPTLVQVVQGRRASSTVPTPAQPDTGCPLTYTGDARAFVYLPCLPHKVLKMNTSALIAQNCSLFEIDAELEAAFDQMQEEREITGNIRPGWG